MKLIRTTALTAALMTAAVPSLTTPANAWGWGWRGGWGWGGVGLGYYGHGYPYYGYIGYPAYYGYGFAYPAYGYGYGSGYYGGYRYAYHPVIRRHIYARAVGVRRHCYGAFCDLPLPVLVAAGL
jgi:hypothetical protein